jgi:DNA (cytosine-5)-methyltransferase 1
MGVRTLTFKYVDTTKTITHISLCAGYGGIDLGLKRAISNLRTIAFSEIEAFACANLVSKMEAGLLDCAPIWTNLKTFPWEEFRDRVDILSGGYPCQPFSAAGKRLGTEDPRHLWPFISNGIALMRPSVCFFENVEGHISLGLPDVIEDLGRLGYRTTWGIFSASEVGAPHQRKRVFIMAHRKCEGLEGWRQRMQPEGIGCRSSKHIGEGGNSLVNTINYEWGNVSREQRTEEKKSIISISSGMADTNNCRSWQNQQSSELRTARVEQSPCNCRGTLSGEGSEITIWPSRPGQPQYEWEPPRVVGNAKHNGLPTSEVSGGSDQALHNLSAREDETKQPTGASRSDDDGGISESERGVVGNAKIGSNGQLTTEQQGGGSIGRPMQEGGVVGNSSSERPHRGCEDGAREQPEVPWEGHEDMGNANGMEGRGASNIQGIQREWTTNSIRFEGTSEGAMAYPEWGDAGLPCGEIACHSQHMLKSQSSGGKNKCEIESEVGLCPHESSHFLGETLTLNPYGHNVHEHENLSKKRRAREILHEVWTSASSEAIQWTIGGLQHFLTKKILQSEMQLDWFTQRICYFVWCIQTGHPIQGWGLSGMWIYESCGNPSQRQEPIEQFKRELGYALCQLSYEIALERGKEAVETTGILHGVRESSERAWVLSEALPEMEEVWRSTLNQEVWEKGCYVEATSIGNRTDELRLLGNGVVPATAELAFRTLWQELTTKL